MGFRTLHLQRSGGPPVLLSSLICVAMALVFRSPVTADDEPPAKAAVELRTWTDTTGTFEIEARYVSYERGNVTLRSFDDRTIVVPLTRLSKPDRDYVRKRLKSAATSKRPMAAANDAPPDDRGVGMLPLKKPRAFLHLEGEAAPTPELAVRGRWTDPNRDPALLVAAERERLKTLGARNKAWEQKLQIPLVRIETHQLAVHAQLPVVECRKIGIAVERVKLHLQEKTGTLFLTPFDPSQRQFIVVVGDANYDRLLKLLESEYEGKLPKSWEAIRTWSASSLGDVLFCKVKANGTPPANIVASLFANHNMKRLTKYRAPDWLHLGFAYYCETIALGSVRMRYFDYQPGVGVGQGERVAPQLFARIQGFVPWSEILERDLVEFKPVHHVQAYGMVRYLFSRDPQAFQTFVAKVRDGETAEDALAASFSMPVAKLDEDYRRWLTGGR